MLTTEISVRGYFPSLVTTFVRRAFGALQRVRRRALHMLRMRNMEQFADADFFFFSFLSSHLFFAGDWNGTGLSGLPLE